MNLNSKPGLIFAVLFILGLLTYTILEIFLFWSTILILSFVFLHFILKISSDRKETDQSRIITPKIIKSLFIILFIIFLGNFRMMITTENFFYSSHISQLGIYENFINVVGKVVEIKKYPDNVKVIYIEPEQILLKGEVYKEVKGNIRIVLKDKFEVKYGDVIKTGGVFVKPLGQRNPGGFNKAQYLERENVFGDLRIPSGYDITNLNLNNSNFLVSGIFKIKLAFENILIQNHSGNNSAFLKAILIGERGELDNEIVEDFRGAGTIHLLAVSGLHMGFVILFMSFFLRILRVPKINVAPFVIIAGTLFYIVLTGANPPVLRAGIFAILYYLGVFLQRRRDNINILFVTALIILIVNPLEIYNAGFQLSFCAVGGILYALQITRNWLTTFVLNDIYQKVYYKIMVLGIASLGAVIGTAIPVSYHFNTFVFGSFILNLIIIPISGFLVGLGFIELVFGLFLPNLISYVAELNDILIDFVFRLNQISSNFDFLKVDISRYEFPILCLLIISILLFPLVLSIKSNNRFKLVFTYSILAFGLVFQLTPEKKLKTVFLDIGQGDSAIISLVNDQHYLFDAGMKSFDGYDAGAYHILPYLKWEGIRKFNGAFISHYNLDHFGGLGAILKEVYIDTIYVPALPKNDSVFMKLISEYKGNYGKIVQLGKDDKLFVNDKVKIDVLSPNISGNDTTITGEVNEESLVVKVSIGINTILFTGDIGFKTEKLLINNESLLNSSILKIGHHGSKYSSSLEFLKKVNPRYSIIQSGKYNSYGHPTNETIERLQSIKTTILRNDLLGAILFEFDNGIIKLKNE